MNHQEEIERLRAYRAKLMESVRWVDETIEALEADKEGN